MSNKIINTILIAEDSPIDLVIQKQTIIGYF